MAGSENGSNSARSKADCANCKANHYGVASNMPPSVPIRRVDLIDIESLGSGPTAFCRCYKSKTFPLCDGAHNAHNAETGDNAGPVVIKPMPDADVNREFLSETTQEEKLRLPPGSKRANNYGVVSTMPPDAPSRRVDMIDSALAVSRADAEGELRLCRCYKSAIFPLCDGSHQVHNRDTGDNTGPIVLKRGVGVDVANITKAANEPTPRSTPKSTSRSTPRSTLKPTSEPKKPAVLRTISMAEVATHNTPTDLWTVIHGKVYDLSDFVQSHPGGAAVLRMYAGKVADEGFDGVHTEEVIMQNLPAEKLVGLISAGEMQSGAAAAVTAPDIDLCLNLYDFEAVAKRVMKDSSFAYYATGATDEFTKQGNQAIFRRIKLVPTVMVDVSNVSLETTMLGARMSFPVYISGAAKGGLAHADGEVALARAAHTAGVVQMAPHMATRPLREIAAVRTIAQTQFLQLYVEKDRAATARTVREAEELGFKALFITVDSAGIGKRETDLRLTPGGSAPRSVASKRRWADDLSWADLPWLRSLTNLKLVLKGVQSGADAVRAYRAGVDGIVVSNHGGRNLDTARPALEALVEVMDALKREGYVPSQPDGTPGSARATSGTSNRLGCLRKCLGRPVGRASFEVFVDGGVYRGSDVYKALALGARAVGVGRAVLWGLAGYGQQGAERVLEMLYNELHTTMMFMGKRSLAEVDETSLSGVRDAMLANAWSATRENLTSISSSEQPDTHR